MPATSRPLRRRTLAALALAGAPPLVARAQPRPVRVVLNTTLSGPQSFLFLAADELAAQGITLDFTPGLGANTAAPRMVAEGFDVGFGDINALAELVAKGTPGAPLAVFAVFPATPNAVAVRADGRVRQPADLAGAAMVGHPTDTALHTFPAFAAAAGLDPRSVRIETSEAAMGDFMRRLAAGGVDGVFGWVNTMVAASRDSGVDPAGFRFVRYRDLLPGLHGGAIMVQRSFAAERPEVVRALLVACRNGIAAAERDPDAAIAALMRRAPTTNPAVQKERMMGTLANEMTHPDVARLGRGGADPARLGESFRQLAAALAWPRAPAADEVFSPAYLPA